MYSKKTGFTLVEILVASTIGAFISMIAVGSLRTVIKGNEMVEKNINAAAEVRFAANAITRDLTNFYRTDNIEDTEFFGSIENVADYDTSFLIFYTVSRTKARLFEPECDVYEVEYYLEPDDEDTLSLMRRQWPNPNEDFEPGGILTKIAENIEYFDISYYDGEDWYSEWILDDMQILPDLVEVTIITTPLGLGNQIFETSMINLTRSVNETAATVQ